LRAYKYCNQRVLKKDSVKKTDSNEQFKTDQHRVLLTVPNSSAYAQKGRLFAVVDNTSLSAQNFFHNILITNPLDSGRIMYLNTITGGAVLSPSDQTLSYESALEITLIRNPSFVVTQNLSIVSLNFGFTGASAMMAGRNTAHQGGSTAFSTLQTVNPILLDFAGEIVIPPGNTIAIQFAAFGLTAGNPDVIFLNTTATWYELDLPGHKGKSHNSKQVLA